MRPMTFAPRGPRPLLAPPSLQPVLRGSLSQHDMPPRPTNPTTALPRAAQMPQPQPPRPAPRRLIGSVARPRPFESTDRSENPAEQAGRAKEQVIQIPRKSQSTKQPSRRSRNEVQISQVVDSHGVTSRRRAHMRPRSTERDIFHVKQNLARPVEYFLHQPTFRSDRIRVPDFFFEYPVPPGRDSFAGPAWLWAGQVTRGLHRTRSCAF